MGRYLNQRGCRFPFIRSWSVIGTCLALSFLEVGCTTIAERQRKFGAPPNYRQLIARKLTQEETSPISSATISQPVEVFAGAINGGGTRPIICATTVTEGGLLPLTTKWIFVFEDGQLSAQNNRPGAMRAGAIWCAGVPESPFPEALKRNG
jgi:hypothetical protein